ncbi:MAG: phosphoribosylformylglycinamidine cyclo-ligase [Caldisericia bacterium]|nr:phosphoribosylformylglycinamidine cyclo-ligase [Caldisericia bacterium]
MGKYEQSGVSIDKGDLFIEKIRASVDSTKIPGVIGSIGFFGGLFEMPQGYSKPVLVSGADGVGTKVKIAIELGKHDTVGIDCVAMNVDDIVCSGAKPLFFLDYLAVNNLDLEVSSQIVAGVAEGCKMAGCALVGGETAQMGDLYQPNEYDLAGFAVGIVEKDDIIDGSKIEENDIIIGLPSSGLHSNGYSLARKVLFPKYKVDQKIGDIDNIGLALLEPTKIYCKKLVELLKIADIHAISHITGGGLADNLPRVMPFGTAVLNKSSIPKIPIIDLVLSEAKLEEYESFKTLNMGIGMALFANKSEFDKIKSIFKDAAIIGKVEGKGKPSFRLE